MRFVPNIATDVISNIEQSNANVQTALQEVSTGQKVATPSDNPAASAAYLQLEAESANVDQYTSNTDSALSQAQTADSVVTSVVGLLNQAITLGVEGANGTESTSDRQALASSVQGLLSNVVGLANTSFQGVPLFAGTATGVTAFTASSTSSTGYQYNGNNSIQEVQVGDSLSVQTSVPGDTLFDNSSASVLGALSGLATALTSGSTAAISSATSSVTAALNYVTEQHVVYGGAINQLNAQESYLAQDKVTLSTQATSLVGIDSATAAEDLSAAEQSNSAVLAASSKVLQNTLLNYLATPS
jgi:flagellar hook-associated protein 3 FlgL